MSSNSLSQGAKANLNGKIFEDICDDYAKLKTWYLSRHICVNNSIIKTNQNKL